MSNNPHSIPDPKVNPAKRPVMRPDNTPDDNDRFEIGPTPLAYAEWEQAGLQCPDLPAMRQYRLDRIVAGLKERDLDAVLLFDPLSIRYATDTTHMQLWNAHNPFRACLITPDGYMVLWEYGGYAHLSEFNPLVREVRTGASFFYFATGQRTEEKAEAFVDQVVDVLQQRVGSGRRVAVDKIQIAGLRALDAAGVEVMDGEELMERTRAIKGPDEILAMRCASHACETSVAAMERFAREMVPQGNTSEDDVWAVLHAENIRRGGEWIETRLLASGQRTNPWFQECGPRIVQNNEIISFDTDLIGSYGICIDISRSWWIGDEKPPAEMVYAMQHAHEHIMTNMEMLKPGVMIPELTANAHVLDDQFQAQKYGCLMHGVGLCDEWPLVAYPDAAVEGAYDYPLEPGMVLCVEAAVGAVGGAFSIKLEDQVLVTEDGYENLTTYPFDPALMGA